MLFLMKAINEALRKCQERGEIRTQTTIWIFITVTLIMKVASNHAGNLFFLIFFFFSLNKKNTEIRNFKLYTYVYLGVMCIYLTFLGQGFDR